MRRYKIYGQSSPSEIITYEGEFLPVPGQSDIITALAAEFANGDLDELVDWLGGNADLSELANAEDEYELVNDDAVFRIVVIK